MFFMEIVQYRVSSPSRTLLQVIEEWFFNDENENLVRIPNRDTLTCFPLNEIYPRKAFRQDFEYVEVLNVNTDEVICSFTSQDRPLQSDFDGETHPNTIFDMIQGLINQQ